MDRVSAWTTLCTPEGLFRWGSQAGGVPATPLVAGWLNMLQEELVAVVMAYQGSLNPEDSQQLLKSLRAMVANFATKATTLAGYGILDAYTKAQADMLLSQKANNAITLGGYGIGDAYTKAEVDHLLTFRAAVANTLAGYGILDAYTRAEVDAGLAAKQNKNTALMAATGWKLDSATGLLEQWGSGSAGPDATTAAIDFPRPFAEVYSCFGNKTSPNATDGDGNSAGAFAISNTQYKLFNDTANFAAAIQWRALGKAPGY
ncbi:phage tail protein [Pseudomonas putida]|uniref:Phage tail protein n=1 Tax=Pseudomonas putida TaxID=303 RepID=A0A6I6XM68_PSEPU|nr:phage tail protein [Pseudomonas putida]MBH3449130.1 phage tail protein [Pseudomonas putida]QHG66758.1 phage tail protein [Pseudomonas putida]